MKTRRSGGCGNRTGTREYIQRIRKRDERMKKGGVNENW